MAGLNKVMLIGHLGRDPEMKYAASGLAIANINLATTEKFKGEDRTEWHRIVVFDKLAEICGQYLKKGSQAYFEGRLKTKEWTDKDGNKRYTTEIVANNMVMLGGRDAGQGRQQRPAQQPTPEPGPSHYDGPPLDDGDDDIPFSRRG
ncbi:single-strand binding protein [Desulfatibacillum aliphaticivorans]|uniref:Single-stranded DNA-binding protein n=1 Tax=Desulfatibacillum aliphaticivorans TaxID=218208 RepID=B8FNJ8_DESAL|nr:single-stranded DNA-binding protein [Desulfatibacillum aliphaticivorans]ACL06279.1 single-strand binding protein [Desulfatibacillum aliphaticivorans]